MEAIQFKVVIKGEDVHEEVDASDLADTIRSEYEFGPRIGAGGDFQVTVEELDGMGRVVDAA
jgi:hypothetical protein